MKLNYLKLEKKKINLPESIDIKNKARKQKIQRKIDKVIKNKSYQVVKQATKEGNKYLNFNNKERAMFKESMKLFIGISKEKLQSGKTFNDVKEIVSRYADKEIKYINEDIKSAKNDIRNRKIKIEDNLKNNK